MNLCDPLKGALFNTLLSCHDNGLLSIFCPSCYSQLTCCEANRFSKNATCHFSMGKKLDQAAWMTISHPFVHKEVVTMETDWYIFFHYSLSSCQESCFAVSALCLLSQPSVFLGGYRIEYAHSFETQHFSFTPIIALCYDKLACDRSLGFVFSVITKRRTWQLITNPVSNKEVSISAVASASSRNVSYWTLINEEKSFT